MHIASATIFTEARDGLQYMTPCETEQVQTDSVSTDKDRCRVPKYDACGSFSVGLISAFTVGVLARMQNDMYVQNESIRVCYLFPCDVRDTPRLREWAPQR
jgi:hypothetical protein